MDSLEKFNELIDLLTYEQLDILDKNNCLRVIKKDLESLKKLKKKEIDLIAENQNLRYQLRECEEFEDRIHELEEELESKEDEISDLEDRIEELEGA